MSPVIVDGRADFCVVDAAESSHGAFGERREAGGAAIVGNLFGTFAAGNGAGNGVEHENPTEGELTHGHARGQDGANIFRSFNPGLVVHAGESLADVKRLAVTVEIAVVVCGKLGVATKFSGQQTAGQRNAGQNADLLLFGERKEFFGGALAEAIEDNLHRLDVGELNGL